MLGDKPLTRKMILKLLDKPENAELKQTLDADPPVKEAVIEIMLKADKAFDSVDSFKSALNAFEKKNRLRKTLAGSEAIV